LGRPRRVFSKGFRVVTDLEPELWRRFRDLCRRENTSIRKELHGLVASYCDGPVYRVVYRDPLLFERVLDTCDYPSALRECLGWVDFDAEVDLRIVWDRPVRKVPGEKDPVGPSGLTIPKGCVVELWRLGVP